MLDVNAATWLYDKALMPIGVNDRYRIQQRFWLDVTKPGDYELACEIVKLKKARRFTPMIRKALRLFIELSEGRIETLFEYFPDLDNRLRQRYQVAGEGALEARLAKLEAQIGSGPKPLAVPPVAAPDDDDDDIALVVTKAAADGQASANFLASAFSLQE